jgi:hypothetical protein
MTNAERIAIIGDCPEPICGTNSVIVPADAPGDIWFFQAGTSQVEAFRTTPSLAGRVGAGLTRVC